MAQLSQLITQTVGNSTAGVNLISAPNQGSIWTPTTVSVTTTTTAAELPLGPTIAQAARFALAGSTGSAYVDFDVPTALLGSKLGLQWFARASATTIGSITLSLASFASSANRTSNTSPTTVTLQTSSVQSAAPGFQTSFDVASQQFFRLTLNFPAASGQWYTLCQLSVGPGSNTQGAAISEWQSYPPTVTGVPTSTTNGRYRRVGSAMEIEASFTASGASTGTISVRIPTGFTIDTAALSTTAGVPTLGSATARIASVNYAGVVNYGSTTTVVVTSGTVNWWGDTASTPGTWASGSLGSFKFTVPIAEWAGNGTVNLGPGAQVEFASNSTAWGTTNTSAFQYGPAGAAITGSAGGSFVQRVRFQYPIQVDDVVSLELRVADGNWVSISDSVAGYQNQNTSAYGARLTGVSGSTTDYDVSFQQFMAPGPTYGSTASAINWSTSFATAWRVRKAKASSPVGFSRASPATGFGLVAPRRGQTTLEVTGSMAGWTTRRAVAVYYQDQDGNHRLKFNITGSFTSKTLNGGDTLTITGITFKNASSFEQACATFNNGTNPAGYAFANPNTNTISASSINSTLADRMAVSGDVELESRPTWA